jgi:hypothetical protein
MKITGKKVIRLSAEEKELMRKAGHLLSDLAEQIDSMGADIDFVMRLNAGYDVCLDVVREEQFEYILDDGEE